MAEQLFTFIAQHGYVTIFVLVFLVEIGIPNPVPNELVLLYAGSLTATGVLHLVPAFLAAVLGDFIGTTLLFTVFYFFGTVLQNFKWFPKHKLEVLSAKISKRGKWGIFLGRLIPYIRGYTSVAAGLMQIQPRVFMSVVVFSALLWSGGYVLAGHFIGPKVVAMADQIGAGQNGVIAVIILCALIFFVASHFISKRSLKE